TIDGWSQGGAGYQGPPLIELRSIETWHLYTCLTIEASDCTVQGLVINGRWEVGIELRGAGASGNVLRGNYVGTTADGNTEFPMKQPGDLVDSYLQFAVLVTGPSNTLGGLSAQDRNIFGARVRLIGAEAVENVVVGNYFGLTATGDSVL